MIGAFVANVVFRDTVKYTQYVALLYMAQTSESNLETKSTAQGKGMACIRGPCENGSVCNTCQKRFCKTSGKYPSNQSCGSSMASGLYIARLSGYMGLT